MKFKSEILNKEFDTAEACLKAEADYKLAQKEKQDKEATAKQNRAKDAESVKTIVAARITAEKEALKANNEAYKTYLEARKANAAKVDAAKKAESEALKDFCKKYGAFHSTVTVDDITYTCDYSLSNRYIDPFEHFLLNLF